MTGIPRTIGDRGYLVVRGIIGTFGTWGTEGQDLCGQGGGGACHTWTLRETDNATAQTQRLSILTNLVKSVDQHIAKGQGEGISGDTETDTSNKDNTYSKSSEAGLDDTTGWRALETNWQCLACWIASLGGSFYTCLEQTTTTTADITGSGGGGGGGGGVPDLVVTQLLSQLEYSCKTHVNRQ
jgi:hypothetical protein